MATDEPQGKVAKRAAMQDWLAYFIQSGQMPKGKNLDEFLKDIRKQQGDSRDR